LPVLRRPGDQCHIDDWHTDLRDTGDLGVGVATSASMRSGGQWHRSCSKTRPKILINAKYGNYVEDCHTSAMPSLALPHRPHTANTFTRDLNGPNRAQCVRHPTSITLPRWCSGPTAPESVLMSSQWTLSAEQPQLSMSTTLFSVLSQFW